MITIIRLFNNLKQIQMFKFDGCVEMTKAKINGYKSLYPECVKVIVEYYH